MKKIVVGFILLFVLSATVIIVSAQDCEENWVCGEWGECAFEGVKSKTCNETNACNTTLFIPSTNRSCTYTCGPNWKCTIWSNCSNNVQTRICKDYNLCVNATGQPPTSQSCGNVSTNQTLTNSALNASINSSQPIADDGCEGCLLENKCWPHGSRFEYNGSARFCDEYDSKIKHQKLRNALGQLVACTHSYECKSNVCEKSKCVDIEEKLNQTNVSSSTMFFIKFKCRLFHLFKPSGYNECIYESLVARIQRAEQAVNSS